MMNRKPVSLYQVRRFPMPHTTHMSLQVALRLAAEKKLEDGWLYLPTSDNPRLDTPCLLISDHEDSHVIGVENGFHQEGLDTQDLEGTALCARQFQSPPSDDLLLESFVYYWRFDAWLPEPGAAEPLSAEEMQREFYDLLGAERENIKCRNSNCSRGAISNSVFCRVHHFEMIRKIPCPYHV